MAAGDGCALGGRDRVPARRSRPRRNTFSSAAAGWRTLPAATAIDRGGDGRLRPRATARGRRRGNRSPRRRMQTASVPDRGQAPSHAERRGRSDAAGTACKALRAEHRRAPDRARWRSSCPSFSRSTPLSGRGCSWAEPWQPGWGSARRSAGRRPGSSGRGRGVASGVGAYLGLELDGTPERGQARRAAATKALPMPSSLLEKEKDWIKNKFDGKIKELEKKRETMVRDAEELLAARVSRVPEPASEANGRGRQDVPGAARANPRSPRRRAQESRGTLSAPHRRPQGKIRKRSPRPRRVLPEDERDHQASLRTGMGQPDQELDRGDGAGRPDGERSSRRGGAPVPGLGAARAGRLEAADRGASRHAVRRLRRRPQSFPERRARRPAAQIGADPFSASGPLAVSDSGLGAHQGGRRGQG